MTDAKKKQLEIISKRLAYILRHDPSKFNLTIKNNGWVAVDDLIYNYNNHYNNMHISKDILTSIILDDEKGRFSYSNGSQYIKANHGHSTSVNIDDYIRITHENRHQELFHATPSRNKFDILYNGLRKMNRLFVHFTPNKSFAIECAKRKDNNIILFELDIDKFLNDNNELYMTKYFIYLSDDVLPKYLKYH